MDSRKVQRLGPSTLAMTLPAEWARRHGVEKGDALAVDAGETGTLTVTPAAAQVEGTAATIHAAELPTEAVERAVVSQYVLGRRAIHVEAAETLDSTTINAVYDAETQLMGLGVVEETPERITIRCSVDPADFTLDNLLERLESTGSTMREEAVTALARTSPDLAERALNRERQANKIFVLLLRLILTAHRDPKVGQKVGLSSDISLVGYRSIAKNLELTADNAEDVADVAVAAADDPLDIDRGVVRRIREFTDQVSELTALAVEVAVDRDYERSLTCRERYDAVRDREADILADLSTMPTDDLLRVREVLVSLQQTAGYAMRNVEIATNLALDEDSDHVTIE